MDQGFPLRDVGVGGREADEDADVQRLGVFVETLDKGEGLGVERPHRGHGDGGGVGVEEGPEGVPVDGVVFDGAVDEAGGTPGVGEGGGVVGRGHFGGWGCG